MNLRQYRPKELSCVIAAAAAGLFVAAFAAPSSEAYESPNFDAAPFEADALSLDDNARDEIVGALAALALNFPEDDQVDDDLREKAIAVALSIDPLDGSARAAHDSLSTGKNADRVDFFSTLRSISKALWRQGERLSALDAEPEDRKLAPFLMEIALVAESDPDDEQIRSFGRATQLKPVNWSSLVRLQGSAYRSNWRAQSLMTKAEELGGSSTGRPGPRPGPGPGVKPRPGGGKGGPPSGEVAEIKRPQPVIRYVAFDSERGAVPGEVKLDVRQPNQDEQSLFGLFLASEGGARDSFVMRLAGDPDGPTVSGFESAGNLVKNTYPRWPKNLIGEFTFKAAGGNGPSQVELALPCAMLLESAFSGSAIPPEIALCGSMTEDGGIVLPASGEKLARAAGIGDGAAVKVLLMPAAGESGLTDAVTSGDLSVLVRPQVVAFGDYDDAKALIFGPRPEKLTEALQKFGDIQNLTAQGMSLDEISKNPAVQERLRAISELWPGHLSARIMLAHGTQPADMLLSPDGSLGQIDTALKPIAKHYTDSVFGGGTVVGDAEKLIEKGQTALRNLRPKINGEARDCLNAADRAIEAFGKYFSVTNKSSSRAAQLRRELQEAINALNSERSRLGATENIAL